MSFAATLQSKHTRNACQSCRGRKARFSYRGSVRADRDHTLCFECYRRERERQRARLPLEATEAPPDSLPLPGAVAGSLDDRQLAHRRAMLAYQERSAASTRISRAASA